MQNVIIFRLIYSIRVQTYNNASRRGKKSGGEDHSALVAHSLLSVVWRSWCALSINHWHQWAPNRSPWPSTLVRSRVGRSNLTLVEPRWFWQARMCDITVYSLFAPRGRFPDDFINIKCMNLPPPPPSPLLLIESLRKIAFQFPSVILITSKWDSTNFDYAMYNFDRY